MKTLVKTFSLLTAILVLSFNAVCGTPESTPDQTLIRQAIQSQLKISVEKSESVTVLFTTDAKGKVNLAIAKTENPALKKAIEENFMKLQISNLVPDNCYSIQLSLKLL